MTELLIEAGNGFAAATKSLMLAAGNFPNLLIMLGIVAGLAMCIKIIVAEKYEEA
jgi:hypothetical protein